MPVDVSAEWLEGGRALPDRCVRHGLPAVRSVAFVVRSRPKISSRRRMLLPTHTAFDRADEYLRAVRTVTVSGWPLCATCVRERRTWLSLAGVLFFGGLAALVASFVIGGLMSGDQPLLLIPLLAGFAAILASPIPLGRGALPRLTRAETTSDGQSVRITEPHPEFVARLAASSQARQPD